jgi:hypothetical protein
MCRVPDLRKIELRPSHFVDADQVGFGIAYIRNPSKGPTVGVATVDYSTGAENTVEVRPREPFQVGGQTWQVTRIRNASSDDWTIVLRRTDRA